MIRKMAGEPLLPPSAKQNRRLPNTSYAVRSVFLDTGNPLDVPEFSQDRKDKIFSRSKFRPSNVTNMEVNGKFARPILAPMPDLCRRIPGADLQACGTRAISGVDFTAGGLAGPISAKPARRIAYAARIPNAIDPTAAQINIAKFNIFATETAWSKTSCNQQMLRPPHIARPGPGSNVPSFAAKCAALTLFSVAN